MQYRTFDRLARNLAAQPTRRGFLGGLGALFAGGFATTALGQRRDFEKKLDNAADNPDEQLVLFFEEVGRITAENDGTCEDLASKLKDFRDTYFEKLESLRAVELTWSKDRLIQHVNTYAERREAVVVQLTPALERCIPESDESGEATPVAMFPSADLAALVPTGMERAAVDDFYSQSASCSADNFNFMAEAYCYRHNSDWQSPSFQWQAWCPSGVIDDKCDLCATDPSGTIEGAGICTKYWPQDCIKDGENVCAVDYHDTHGGLASAICDKADASKIFSDTTYCYSRESSWSSPKFTWSVYCPDGHIEHNCIDCQTDAAYEGLAGPEICAKYWPQDCLKDGTRNICYVGYHVTCCEESCPVSSGDCTYSYFDSMFGNARCAACMTNWCGSMDRCMTDCNNEGCCKDECSSHNVIPHVPPVAPDQGGLVRRGTPVPLGTPVGTPINPPPLPPGTPGTEVPPPLPPGTPATEIPTEVPPPLPPGTPGTPNASPAA